MHHSGPTKLGYSETQHKLGQVNSIRPIDYCLLVAFFLRPEFLSSIIAKQEKLGPAQGEGRRTTTSRKI